MKVGIIGLGSISEKHVYALKSIDPSVEIYALRSKSNSPLLDGITNIYSLNEVRDLSFIIISNPTVFHFETIQMVAKYGIPMMIEKPAFYKLDGVGDLVDYINEKGIFTYVACNLRFHPCIQFLKTYISKDTSKINEVNIYCGSYLPEWRPNRDYREIYSANLAMGGGVHLDLFHEMDYACWIFGLPNSHKGYTSNLSTLEIDAPDYANYLLSYGDFNISMVLNYYRKKPRRTIEVLFDNETWIIDLLLNKITNDKQELIYEKPSFNLIDTYVEQMRCFIAQIGSERSSFMNDINETVEILKITLSNESIKR